MVLDLTDPLPSGHNITCDNFFTTHNLAMTLLRRKQTLVGTVRKNKLFLPPIILDLKKKPIFYSKFLFTEKATIVSYVPKKYKFTVLYSTLHHTPDVHEDQQKKPDIIHFYNKTKAGVDALDQLVCNYTCKRKTNRWPVALFCNMLDISAYNSFVLWTKLNPSWNANKKYRRRLYLLELGYSMIDPHIVRRERLPYGKSARNAAQQVKIRNEPQPSFTVKPDTKCSNLKRSRCFICPNTANANKVSTKCNNCNKYVCKSHMTMTIICQNCHN